MNQRMKKIEEASITDLPFNLGTLVISFGPHVECGIPNENLWIKSFILRVGDYRFELQKAYYL